MQEVPLRLSPTAFACSRRSRRHGQSVDIVEAEDHLESQSLPKLTSCI